MNAALRRRVVHRARNRCEYCRLHQDYEPYYRFHLEHIIARQHGGSDAVNNLAFACHHCNEHKGPNLSSVDPRTGLIVRLFHPRQQKWPRHFRRNGARIIGRTQCGRATVAILKMNMRDRMNLRIEMLIDESMDTN